MSHSSYSFIINSQDLATKFPFPEIFGNMGIPGNQKADEVAELALIPLKVIIPF